MLPLRTFFEFYEIGHCSKSLLIVYGLGYCLCYVVQFYYFCINNVVGKPIINKSLFYVSKFVKEDSHKGR